MRVFSPERLRERRLELGFTQAFLGTLAGIAREHIVEIEKGRCSPNTATLAKLASALRVRECYFFVSNGR